jgi:hypothetical protein
MVRGGDPTVAQVYLGGGPTIVQRFENETLKFEKWFTEFKGKNIFKKTKTLNLEPILE